MSQFASSTEQIIRVSRMLANIGEKVSNIKESFTNMP